MGLAQARAGVPLGPLAGQPVSIKDLYDVASETTMAGSVVREGERAWRVIRDSVGKAIDAGVLSGDPETELSLRIYFCEKIIDAGIAFQKHDIIRNMYSLQLKKIALAGGQLHEDALYDYAGRIDELKGYLNA